MPSVDSVLYRPVLLLKDVSWHFFKTHEYLKQSLFFERFLKAAKKWLVFRHLSYLVLQLQLMSLEDCAIGWEIILFQQRLCKEDTKPKPRIAGQLLLDALQ